MQYELAKLSLPGHRAENQDRVTVMTADQAALIAVVDGMGGHAEGAKASEAVVECLDAAFRSAPHPTLDPQGFLISALERAHHRLVQLGGELDVDYRPRATCAICLVQDSSAYCAHIGDSRIYHLRGNTLISRSRDHSHVELLVQEGVIDEGQVKSHPMRNFVECCLGGDTQLPDMSIAARTKLEPGDVMLVCSDGLWTGVDDSVLLRLAGPTINLDQVLTEIATTAVANNAPRSDNTSAAVLRINGIAA